MYKFIIFVFTTFHSYISGNTLKEEVWQAEAQEMNQQAKETEAAKKEIKDLLIRITIPATAGKCFIKGQAVMFFT